MTRWRCLPAAILCAPATLMAAAQQPVFRASIDSVVVDVAVRLDGRPVPNLTAADFALTDNGTRQAIVDVSREALPIDVDLIVDTSASMRGARYEALTRAIDDVRRHLEPGDRARLVSFNQRIREADAAPGAAVALPAEGPAGLTSVHDAIVAALIRPQEPSRRHMAIVFSDGVDSSSLLSEADVMDTANRSGVAVFCVALGGPGLFATNPSGAFFQRLAETTGGVFAAIQRNDDLSRSFAAALDEFRTSYVLRYSPDQSAPGWHEITVRIARTGRYDIRARKGYVSGSAAPAP